MVCKTLVEELPEESFTESGLEGYSLAETRSEYGGVPPALDSGPQRQASKSPKQAPTEEVG